MFIGQQLFLRQCGMSGLTHVDVLRHRRCHLNMGNQMNAIVIARFGQKDFVADPFSRALGVVPRFAIIGRVNALVTQWLFGVGSQADGEGSVFAALAVVLLEQQLGGSSMKCTCTNACIRR
jgi:hypothetical protein